MEKLKQLREERGLSQVKLAARADLNPATVNQIERGMRDASPGTLRKLADALEVSLYELLEEEAPKAQAPPQPEVAEQAGHMGSTEKPPPVSVNLPALELHTEAPGIEVRITGILKAVADHVITPEEGARKVLALVAA